MTIPFESNRAIAAGGSPPFDSRKDRALSCRLHFSARENNAIIRALRRRFSLVTKKEVQGCARTVNSGCASNKFAVPWETMNDRATHIEGREMEMRSNEARMTARPRLVEEHVRLENLHDLDGILGTFGPDARYDDGP